MSLFASQKGCTSALSEESASEECLDELHKTIASLQLLVCELLIQNQQLRSQRANE
jgi:hypothetical protein